MAFPTDLTNAIANLTPITAANYNALEGKVGVDNSTVPASLDYQLNNTLSVDPGHRHTEIIGVTPVEMVDVGYVIPDAPPSQANLAAADALAYSLDKQLLLPPGTWDIDTTSADFTLSAAIKVMPGAILTRTGSANNLIINGPVEAGLYQWIADDSVTHDWVQFGAGAMKEVWPDLWATNTAPGTTDMTTAVQSMFNAIPDYQKMVITTDCRVTDNLTITGKDGWTLDCQGKIVPYTTTSPGKWEVYEGAGDSHPAGVLNISGCSKWKLIPNFEQTDIANFGNGNVIYLDDCHNWWILNGTIDMACEASLTGGKAGIRVGDNCYNGHIVNNKLKAWFGIFIGSGIIVPSPYWLNIHDITISGNIIRGNSVTQSQGVSVDGYPSVTGVYYYNINVNGNNFYDIGNGVAFAGVLQSTINGNIVTNCLQGIHVEDGSKYISGNGNIVTNASTHGISVWASPTSTNTSEYVSFTNCKVICDPADDNVAIGFYSLSWKNIAFDSCEVINLHATNRLADGFYSYGENAIRYCKAIGLMRRGFETGHTVNGSGFELIGNIADGNFSGSGTSNGIFFNAGGYAPRRISDNEVINAGTATADYNIGDAGDETVFPGYPTIYFGANIPSTTTTPTTLRTRNILENLLKQNGSGVKLSISGTTAANGNNKQLIVTLGGTTVLDTGATAANNKPWWFEIDIIRITATSQLFNVRGYWNGAASILPAITNGAKDLTTTLALVVKATCPTANNDLRLYNWKLEMIGPGK